ncbi:MAG TPA: FHA domain-containing protein [Thermoanaerobaculia bacterium]|jgi:DNA-binding winged helix-turn-helix (wHTH) protein
MRLGFEGCVFDSDTRQVSRDGRLVGLSPKAFSLLELLIRDRPKAISKEEIHRHLWPGTHVSEASLANIVMELRAELGDRARDPRIVRTVARFGYAFCADAAELAAGAAPKARAADGMYRLIWGRREIALSPGENRIGRDREAVVWIDDSSVSRRHARIVIDDRGTATLEDLGSKNGTFLKGRRIRGATALSDKDALTVGNAVMTFRVLHSTGSTVSNSDRRLTK